MTSSIAFLNNEFLPLAEAKVSVLDRGFLFADGVYEVIPAYQSKLFRLAEHIQRLEVSLRETRIDLPMEQSQLIQHMEDLLTKNGGGNLSIYLQITRGVAPIRDHAFPDQKPSPTVFMMCNAIKEPQSNNIETAQGFKAITAEDIRWTRCDIKSVSLLPNILLRQQAQEIGAAEALLVREGLVMEGAASNLFAVENGKILTPPKNHHILGGITRDLIIELAQKNQLPIEETDISLERLRKADEIWCTSSTKEMIAITALDDSPVGDGSVGPMWKTMAKIYTDFKQSLFFG